MLVALVSQWHQLRLRSGLSQADLGRLVGTSRAWTSRLERHKLRDVSLRTAVRLTAILGGDLSVKVHPGPPAVRDSGHLPLLERFERRVPPLWRVTHESPMLISGDQRAWDRRLDGVVSIGIEAETRPMDLQALERAMQLKLRDSNVDRMILLIADTRRNRELLRTAIAHLRPTLPLATAETLRALAAGRDPGANGLVVL
jgi:transcriptional regulator with XRE-family HTH domain